MTTNKFDDFPDLLNSLTFADSPWLSRSVRTLLRPLVNACSPVDVFLQHVLVLPPCECICNTQISPNSFWRFCFYLTLGSVNLCFYWATYTVLYGENSLVSLFKILSNEAALKTLKMPKINVVFNSQHEMKYLRLVRNCLRTYGLLCLGVYRQLDEVVDENEAKGQRTLTQKRYVITHPPTDFRLIDTDKVLISVFIVFAAVCQQLAVVWT